MQAQHNKSTQSQHNLGELITNCAQESQQKGQHTEPSSCFELFRRAIVEGSNEAWQAVRTQYSGLVRKWLRAKTAVDYQLIDDLEQDTWERFWRSQKKQAALLTEKFEHIGALLNYLRHCAYASVVDEHRRQKRRQAIETNLQHHPLMEANHIWEDIDKKEALSHIRTWIETVTDTQERLILYLSYDRGLTPKEIFLQHPDQFENVKIVRRLKERLIKRAKYALVM